MSKPMSVNVTNNMLSLADFETLTVGRQHNQGTLKVVKDGDRITGLKCVNHHVSSFYRKEKVTEDTAQTLKDAFEQAVNNELVSLASKVLRVAHDSPICSQINEKIQEMKSALARQMSIRDPQSRGFTPLPRAKMGEIISQVNELKASLKNVLTGGDDNLDIIMFKAMNVTKFAPGELEKLDASVFDRVSSDDISRLADKIAPLTAGCVKRFADMVDKFADILEKKAKNEKTVKDVEKFVCGELTPENMRRAAVKSCLRMDAQDLAMLKEAKLLTVGDFKGIAQREMASMARSWEVVQKPRSDWNNLERGMYYEFLRCQTDGRYYEQFSFNGEKAPRGEEGEEFDSYDGTQQINAGLQRKMREMIANPTIRAFVTSMCGMEGFMALPPMNEETIKLDFGHGSLEGISTSRHLAHSGCADSASRRFDLSIDENRNLIFTQKVNFTHPFCGFYGGEKGKFRLKLNDKDQFAVSKNVLELKMRIPLDQVVKAGKMLKVQILSVTQTIEDQEPNVYTHHKG